MKPHLLFIPTLLTFVCAEFIALILIALIL